MTIPLADAAIDKLEGLEITEKNNPFLKEYIAAGKRVYGPQASSREKRLARRNRMQEQPWLYHEGDDEVNVWGCKPEDRDRVLEVCSVRLGLSIETLETYILQLQATNTLEDWPKPMDNGEPTKNKSTILPEFATPISSGDRTRQLSQLRNPELLAVKPEQDNLSLSQYRNQRPESTDRNVPSRIPRRHSSLQSNNRNVSLRYFDGIRSGNRAAPPLGPPRRADQHPARPREHGELPQQGQRDSRASASLAAGEARYRSLHGEPSRVSRTAQRVSPNGATRREPSSPATDDARPATLPGGRREPTRR